MNDKAKLLGFLSKLNPFSQMNDEQIKGILNLAKQLSIKAGDCLMSQGEAADSLYLVLHGRFLVYKDDSYEQAIGELGQGEIIGELAIITGEPRAATIYAARDSNLLKIDKEVFQDFFLHNPLVFRDIVKCSILNLTNPTKPRTEHKIIGLCLAGSTENLQSYSSKLHDGLIENNNAVILSSDNIVQHLQLAPSTTVSEILNSPAQLIEYIFSLENTNDFILLVADEKFSAWTDFCLRQSDKIILFAKSDVNINLNETEDHIFKSVNKIKANTLLAVNYGAKIKVPDNTQNWIGSRNVSQFFNTNDKLANIIRTLTGNSYSLVLSGGGARALAHIGVYKALIELGYDIDTVAGTSGGAIVAALIAKQLSIEEMKNAFRLHYSDKKKTIDLTLPYVSLIKSKQSGKALKDVFGEDFLIENLAKRFFCVSTNFNKHKLAVHSSGLLWQRLRASASLPAILPPITIDGDLHVDGGVLNNLPVDIMKEFSPESKVISSEVIINECNYKIKNTDNGSLSGWAVARDKLFDKDAAAIIPSIATIISESIAISQHSHLQKMPMISDLYFPCNTSQFDLLDFTRIDEIVELGYQVVMNSRKD